MDFKQRVPVIDISPYVEGSVEGKKLVARQIDNACRDLGFLVIQKHAVPLDLIQKMHESYFIFFNLPLEEKMKWGIGLHSPFAGYIRQGNSFLSKTKKLSLSLQNGKTLNNISSPTKKPLESENGNANGYGNGNRTGIENGIAGNKNENGNEINRSRAKEVHSSDSFDLKESFGIGPPFFPIEDYFTCERGQTYFQVTPWPDSHFQPGLRELLKSVTVRYWEHMETLTQQLLGAMAIALNLPEDYFVSFTDKHISHLFVQHYPLQKNEPVSNQIRAGAHTDFGGITILHLGENPEGLEVFGRRTGKSTEKDGEREREGEGDGVWNPISAPQDSFVINIGDLMQQWTNDVWKSTLHRVVNPAGQSRASSVRQTVTFFNQPNYNAEIKCIPTLLAPGELPKYAPVFSGDHYDMKLSVMRTAQKQN